MCKSNIQQNNFLCHSRNSYEHPGRKMIKSLWDWFKSLKIKFKSNTTFKSCNSVLNIEPKLLFSKEKWVFIFFLPKQERNIHFLGICRSSYCWKLHTLIIKRLHTFLISQTIVFQRQQESLDSICRIAYLNFLTAFKGDNLQLVFVVTPVENVPFVPSSCGLYRLKHWRTKQLRSCKRYLYGRVPTNAWKTVFEVEFSWVWDKWD